MPLTKDIIVSEAERCGFKIVRIEPGPGTRADIVLRDERGGDETITVGLWPESTEADLNSMLANAAAQLRGGLAPMPSPDAWLM